LDPDECVLQETRLTQYILSMLSSTWAAVPRWLPWLALGATTQLQLARAQTAVSTLTIPETNTLISLNLPPNSNDINFYVSTPDWYQYTAIGFGSSMANALMLVMYLSGDGKSKQPTPFLHLQY
jgi:hypothetical protein